ncbi:uncharacterized protein LOC120516413 [Polypterus senegalus]|uniref:uncharacterized protein LOC120516413 n=1 Tax=Polypterus senegalus TaxID=55291 RepID=UPI0019640C6C|nr:uncharacterized protein LOC120516413 [Polypterus senegalus]
MSEYQSYSNRPRRLTRPPAYLKEFEVQYPGQVPLPSVAHTARPSPDKERYQEYTNKYYIPMKSTNHFAASSPTSQYSSYGGENRLHTTVDRWDVQDVKTPLLQTEDADFLPLRYNLVIHDLELENQQLRQTTQSMREEIRRLWEMQVGIQEQLKINQQLPSTHRQLTQDQVPPVPAPRTRIRSAEKIAFNFDRNTPPLPAPRHRQVADKQEKTSLDDSEPSTGRNFIHHRPSGEQQALMVPEPPGIQYVCEESSPMYGSVNHCFHNQVICCILLLDNIKIFGSRSH